MISPNPSKNCKICFASPYNKKEHLSKIPFEMFLIYIKLNFNFKSFFKYSMSTVTNDFFFENFEILDYFGLAFLKNNNRFKRIDNFL